MMCTDEEPCGSSTCDDCNPGWDIEIPEAGEDEEL
jgi:hypothetical protein